MQIPANCPRADITIQEHIVSVPCPFAEGHVLNAGEAAALNQVFHENIRNNVSKKIDAWEKNGTSVQAGVDAYITEYEFGVRKTGPRDPVHAMAVEIAIEKVKEAIRKTGASLKSVSAEDIRERAEKAVAENPKFLQRAKEIVELRRSVAADL